MEQDRTTSRTGDESSGQPQRYRWGAVFLLFVIAWCLLTIHLTLEYSPTIDEIPHAGSGWAIRTAGDFRVNPEHPPLWKILSAIPHSSDALPDGTASPLWPALTGSFILEWNWSAHLLYGSDPERGISYIQRGRRATLVFGLVLGIVVVWWAWTLGGGFAGVLAATFFLLEPNLLAHSSLITSDVPFTATLFLTLLLLQRSRTYRAYRWAAAVGASLGLCLATKFSALVLPPIVAALIVLRPFLRPDDERRRTLGQHLIELLIVALMSYATLWMTYGLRFAPSPDGTRLDVSHAVNYLEHRASETGVTGDGALVSLALSAERYHLLPQAYLVGLIWAKATTLGQPAFLLGEISQTGWWYYFPLALLVKLPTILLLAAVGAIVVAVRLRHGLPGGPWSRGVLLIAPLALLVLAMGSSLNLGVRHVLPIIPALIIVVSVIIAGAAGTRQARASILTLVVLLGATELILIHPHELSYFNVLSGGPSRGLRVLGDSNLDWGQDLSRLGEWSAKHPCTTIHLAYYGTTPPEAYGVSYRPLPVREGAAGLPALQTSNDEVLVVSSRYLQGMELNPEVRPFYELLRDTEPTEVIGTTLYLYRIGPQASCAGG